MSIDPAAFARLIAGYCLDVQPGQQVAVRSTTLAAPLLLALQREILSRDAWPLMRVSLPEAEEQWWEAARETHLDGFPSAELAEIEASDSAVRIEAPANVRALSEADPAQVARAARARTQLREAAMQRRWCLTLWPTPALAQQADLSSRAFEAMVAKALFLDRPDPVAAWRELHETQQRLIEKLTPARELRIVADGTDITFSVEGRTWINSDGKRNMPSGEVFTGPVEDSVNGRVRFTISAGPDVSGVELEFRDGVVVDARAERGEDYLLEAIATDEGSKRLGEVGIGTNFGIDRRTGMILLDEKIGGTVHLALGRSYPETGGTNVSALHWDLICDLRRGGRLEADGVVVQRDGAFV